MLGKYLREDLNKRKGINIIICLFMILATLFLSASLNNILSVSHGIDYFLNVSKVPDLIIFLNDDEELNQINAFLQTNDGVESTKISDLGSIVSDDIHIVGREEKYKGGAQYYIGNNTTDWCKSFDEDNNDFVVNKGEIAVPKSEADKNDIHIGDEIEINFGECKMLFKVTTLTKDSVYGSEMGGMARFIISDEDYEYAKQNNQSFLVYYTINVQTADTAKLISDLEDEDFETIANKISKSIIKLMYVMDLMLAACLILIGVCLILIAFLVLRFTLVFSMQENYSEIGVMQAIGIRISKIRILYTAKYALLVVVGAVIGCIISVPIAKILLDFGSDYMVLAGKNTYLWSNILGGVLVIFVVIMFSYGCTRKIKKMSVIDTIRGGGSGERYHKRKGIKLYSKKHMKVSVFLGLNDVCSNMRRYMVLIVTFCICFVLITIPLNTVNTMNSDEMITKFALNPESDIFVTEIKDKGFSDAMSVEKMNEYIDNLKTELEAEGYKPTLTIPYCVNLKYKKGDISRQIITLQPIGDTEFLDYSEGSAPVLKNEIAFSKMILEDNGWEIGDTVQVTINDEVSDYIISGSYSDYMQTGNSARINPKTDLTECTIAYFWAIMIDLGVDTGLSSDEICNTMNEDFPMYTWRTAPDILDLNIGAVRDVLKSSLIPMTAVIAAIIALVVFMMEHLFIVREKGEIAMLKSIGFKNRVIRFWQAGRMVLSALIAMIIAVPISFLSNKVLLQPVFGIMGAEVHVEVDILNAFVVFPSVLLAVIVLVTVIATLRVRNIKVHELNNLE